LHLDLFTVMQLHW